MLVPAIALTAFVHDDIRGEQGKALQVDEHLGADLERRGLIRIQQMHRRVDRELVAGAGFAVVPGKVPAVGAEKPSSSSPAAQASETTLIGTLHLPRHGKKRNRHGGM